MTRLMSRFLLFVLALGVCLAVPAVAQYQMRFIETGPLERTRIAPNSDYYSVFLSGVYLNQQESFFRKNNIAITANLLVNTQPIPINIYADRDPNTGGRLGIFNKGLIYMIPCVGNPFEMGLSVTRRDKNDPIKRSLDFLNASENDSLLKTFTTGAVPYLSLIGKAAGMFYDSSKPAGDGDKLFLLNAITFMPHDDDESAARDRYALRDTQVVVCRTERKLGELVLDDQGNVCEKTTSGVVTPLRDCPWIAVRIQKFPNRSDFGGREWSVKYREAMRTVLRDPEQAESLYKEGSVLLAADRDFTDSDKLAIEEKTRKALATARKLVADGKSAQVEEAMLHASVPARPLGTNVTPGNANITLAPGASWAQLIARAENDNSFTIKSWDPETNNTPAPVLVFSPERFLAALE